MRKQNWEEKQQYGYFKEETSEARLHIRKHIHRNERKFSAEGIEIPKQGCLKTL